jgi:GNAT superfamily N-acetyltransferase
VSRSEPLIIEPLATHHDRKQFDCGEPSLDRYIRQQANQDTRRRISRVFVATNGDSGPLLGYYTLSALSIHLNDLPPNVAAKLPKHPIPAALVGRLAVAKEAQGDGVGKLLLADAVKRTLAAGEEIAIHALVVDALNDRAAQFYQRFGFTPLESNTTRLYLPLKSL